jgi:hypothetical protein
VPAQGFEPWTFGLKDRCSNQAELRRHVTILNWEPRDYPSIACRQSFQAHKPH